MIYRDLYAPFILPSPKVVTGNTAVPFTEADLKSFDKALGHKRTSQKRKMRRVFQSCGMTEGTYKRSTTSFVASKPLSPITKKKGTK